MGLGLLRRHRAEGGTYVAPEPKVESADSAPPPVEPEKPKTKKPKE